MTFFLSQVLFAQDVQKELRDCSWLNISQLFEKLSASILSVQASKDSTDEHLTQLALLFAEHQQFGTPS